MTAQHPLLSPAIFPPAFAAALPGAGPRGTDSSQPNREAVLPRRPGIPHPGAELPPGRARGRVKRAGGTGAARAGGGRLLLPFLRGAERLPLVRAPLRVCAGSRGGGSLALPRQPHPSGISGSPCPGLWLRLRGTLPVPPSLLVPSKPCLPCRATLSHLA